MELQPDQIDALASLIGEIKVAEGILGKRDTPGRTTPGFYAIGLKTPGGFDKFGASRGGKKRKMRGGAECSNKYVGLAVDSVLILAGAAVATGAAYTGYAALASFMDLMGFDILFKTNMLAFYNIAKVVSQEAFNVTITGVKTAYKSTGAVATFAMDAYNEYGDLMTDLALTRYVTTTNNAIDDANNIIDAAKSTSVALSQKVTGVVTRAAAEKARLQGLAQPSVDALAAKFESVKTTVRSFPDTYDSIKTAICQTLNTAGTDFDYLSFLISIYNKPPSGGRKRKSKRHTKKRTRSTKRSSRRSSRRSTRRSRA